jgi:hypothetical protein
MAAKETSTSAAAANGPGTAPCTRSQSFINQLSPRQAEIYEFYSQAKANIFGPNDYAMIAPDPRRSLFLSDETVCVAKVWFGTKFDLRVRKFAVSYALPALLSQMILLPIGLWVITGNYPRWIFILTILGGIFPIVLLLRSHYQIARHMCMQWEPVFLTLYSFVFCIAVCLLRQFDFCIYFIFGAVFPTLLASAFADASALRLDYAFIKGDISLLALALPPYIASISCIVVILVYVSFGRLHVTNDNGNSLSDELEVRTQSTIQTTGFTIVLFLARSLVLLIIEPRRCVSLHAPMMNSIVTLQPDTSRSTEIVPEGYKNYYVNCVLSARIQRHEECDDISMSNDREGLHMSNIGNASDSNESKQAGDIESNGPVNALSKPSTNGNNVKFNSSKGNVSSGGSSAGRRTGGLLLDVESTHNVITSYMPSSENESF